MDGFKTRLPLLCPKNAKEVTPPPVGHRVQVSSGKCSMRGGGPGQPLEFPVFILAHFTEPRVFQPLVIPQPLGSPALLGKDNPRLDWGGKFWTKGNHVFF